jgi:hypothetical protein
LAKKYIISNSSIATIEFDSFKLVFENNCVQENKDLKKEEIKEEVKKL